jgi:uncharacterized repeat protein (TIGR01451 family)
MFFNKKYILGAFLGLSVFFIEKSLAVKVPAGTIIGNSATATYYDENNNQYTTTSNVVQTVVQAVCGVDVIPDSKIVKEGVPGQVVYLPFQIKNTGNSENTFSLSLQNGSYTKSVYLDENQNGVVDPGEQTVTSLNLGMDEVATVIVSVEIPTTAGVGDTEDFSITVSSAKIGTCSDQGNGQVNVLNDAVISINKSVDKSQALPDSQITYTISFKNIGTKSAYALDGFSVDIDNDGNVETGVEGILVKDAVPSGSIYVSASATGTPTVNPDGFVVYSSDGNQWFQDENALNGSVAYIGFFMPDQNPQDDTLDPVLAPDQQGNLTFKVKVNNPFNDNDSSVDNRAYISYGTSGGAEKVGETNETHTVIPKSAQVDIMLGGLDNPEEDNDSNWKDDNLVKNVPAGFWIKFYHTVKNNGNVDDVINLKVDQNNTDLPQGSVVEFWNSNETAKLLDTDGEGNVDLGTVQKGEERTFVVRVYIPANTPTAAEDGNVDYYLTISAISQLNTGEIDRSRDNIDGIIGAGVDIGKWNAVGDNINNPSDGNTDGTDDSDDILPGDNNTTLKIITDTEKCSQVVKNTVNPGEKAVYPVEILNRGGTSDSFAITVSGAVGSVKILFDDNCDGIFDKEMTNTPLLAGSVLSQDALAGDTEIYLLDVSNIQAGDIVYIGDERKEVSSVDSANKKVVLKTAVAKNHAKGTKVSEAIYILVEVLTQSDQTPGEYNLVITASSENSGAQDSMDAYLKINAVDSLILTPDGSDQLPPGGTTTYQHLITNKGNQPKSIKVVLPEDTKLTYIILDDNKTPQGTSYTLPDPLNPGDSEIIYIKAIAPSDIQPGTVETVEVKLVDADNDAVVYDTAQDTTTVIEGFMQLTKSVDKTEAKPGETVTYTVKYKNIGEKRALNVVITDSIPNYTDYQPGSLCVDTNCDGNCDKTLTDTAGDDEGEYDDVNNVVKFRVGTGADETSGGTVEPGEEGCVIFKVKIKE